MMFRRVDAPSSPVEACDMRRLLLCALLSATLPLGCGRSSEQDAARKDVQRLMEQHMGQKANASAQHTLREVEERLRVGMPVAELDTFIAERTKGPNAATKVMGSPLVEGDPPRADPNKQVRTYFLKDADLTVIVADEKVVSWKSQPIDGK
jgi:hypothetical protein